MAQVRKTAAEAPGNLPHSVLLSPLSGLFREDASERTGMNGRECLRGGASARGSTGTAVNSVVDPEMWVLNQADHVAKGVSDCRHLDVTADRLHGVARLGAAVNQTPVGAVDIRNAPVRNGVVPNLDTAGIRIESELESPDVEPDVARLIKIGRHAEGGGVPRLRRSEIGGVID